MISYSYCNHCCYTLQRRKHGSSNLQKGVCCALQTIFVSQGMGRSNDAPACHSVRGRRCSLLHNHTRWYIAAKLSLAFLDGRNLSSSLGSPFVCSAYLNSPCSNLLLYPLAAPFPSRDRGYLGCCLVPPSTYAVPPASQNCLDHHAGRLMLQT